MSDFYFYTETAFHHQGDIQYLKDLVKASKEAGANGVKFQVLTNAGDFISTRHSAFRELASYCFDFVQWKEIFEYTRSLDLDIIMMPLNHEALELRNQAEIKYVDIHSISFNDKKLHERISESGLQLILGIGGRTLEEIQHLRDYFEDQIKVLMVGFQSFPSKLEDVKLGKIKHMKEKFHEFEIGYADHSAYDHLHAIRSNEYAYLLGATFFEKHITLEEGNERVDSASAVTPDKIQKIIENISFLADNVTISAEDAFDLNEKEITYRNRQAACIAAVQINEGEVIKAEQVTLKLIDDKENILSDVDDVIGMVALKRVEKDAPIKSNQIKKSS